jgi:hypothetical protein
MEYLIKLCIEIKSDKEFKISECLKKKNFYFFLFIFIALNLIEEEGKKIRSRSLMGINFFFNIIIEAKRNELRKGE